MTTIFSAPTVGDPRATGIKNGGIKAFESDIVYPVSRLVGPQFKAGKQMEFRWRSDSNRFWSPRDTKLYVRLPPPEPERELIFEGHNPRGASADDADNDEEEVQPGFVSFLLSTDAKPRAPNGSSGPSGEAGWSGAGRVGLVRGGAVRGDAVRCAVTVAG
jgi:hypothetical protein